MIKVPEDAIELRSLELVWAERLRQKEEEGYTLAHDDQHTGGQLALLAAAYALSSRVDIEDVIQAEIEVVYALPLNWGPYKPKNPIRDLTRAGALILAELERRLRNQDPVSRAIAEGKLQETQRGWAEAFFNRDPAGFRGYVEMVAPKP